ncbi:MAG: hypothetical protein OEM02_05600 [Desulfobulbaceae bacterium]|nr:hypothetical protein [Desulfobulbaceae bacterium]
MHNLIIVLSIFLLANIGTLTHAAPSQLVPCDYIYGRSKVIQIYHKNLDRHFEINGGLEKLNIDFLMYILPSFKNEQAIIGYKMPDGSHVLERLISEDSVWYLLNKYADRHSIQLYDIPDNPDLKLPPITSDIKKKISKSTAHYIKKAVDFAVINSRYDAKEFEGYHGQLDGTDIYFLSSSKKCGSPFVNSAPGPAEKILILSKLLEDFMENKTSELDLLNASKIIK